MSLMQILMIIIPSALLWAAPLVFTSLGGFSPNVLGLLILV